MTRELIDQISNMSATIAKFIANGQPIPQLYTCIARLGWAFRGCRVRLVNLDFQIFDIILIIFIRILLIIRSDSV